MLFEAQDIAGMLNCLHRFDVNPGDTLLIEGGVPHAIGAGCFLVEIQEPTDYTIRVERVTPSGFPVVDAMCHQGLGFERMFDCFHYEPLTREQTRARWLLPMRPLREELGASVRAVVGYGDTPMFALNQLDVRDTLVLPCEDQFSGLYVLAGEGTMACGSSSQPIRQAEQYFIPAGVRELRFVARPQHPLVILQCFGPDPRAISG